MALENFVSVQEASNFSQTPQGTKNEDISGPLKELFQDTSNENRPSVMRFYSASGKEYLLMKKNDVIVAVETEFPKRKTNQHSRSFMFKERKIYEGKVLLSEEQGKELVENILEAERNTTRPRS